MGGIAGRQGGVEKAAASRLVDGLSPVSKGPEALRPLLMAERPLQRGTQHLFLLCRMAGVTDPADLLT